MRKRKAFTLIELLVVVAIIALLVSILVPSLQEAKVQAKLAVCASNLHQISIGMMSYALDYQGDYPRRVLKAPTLLKYGAVDDRPMIRPYLPINFLVCPLSPKNGLDLDGSSANNIYTSYEMWFGTEYVWQDSESRVWNVNDSPVVNGVKFDILVCDIEYNYGNPWYLIGALASHQDSNSRLEDWTQDDAAQTSSYWGIWDLSGNATRGVFDRNFLHMDGSVDRISRLELYDSRLIEILHRTSAEAYYFYLPPKR